MTPSSPVKRKLLLVFFVLAYNCECLWRSLVMYCNPNLGVHIRLIKSLDIDSFPKRTWQFSLKKPWRKSHWSVHPRTPTQLYKGHSVTPCQIQTVGLANSRQCKETMVFWRHLDVEWPDSQRHQARGWSWIVAAWAWLGCTHLVEIKPKQEPKDTIHLQPQEGAFEGVTILSTSFWINFLTSTPCICTSQEFAMAYLPSCDIIFPLPLVKLTRDEYWQGLPVLFLRRGEKKKWQRWAVCLPKGKLRKEHEEPVFRWRWRKR